MWWEPRAPALARAVRDPGLSAHEGACHVRPPVVVRTLLDAAVGAFPVTNANRYCGEWEDRDDGEDPAREDVPAQNVVVLDDARRAA
jgi:hypothetical protein